MNQVSRMDGEPAENTLIKRMHYQILINLLFEVGRMNTLLDDFNDFLDGLSDGFSIDSDYYAAKYSASDVLMQISPEIYKHVFEMWVQDKILISAEEIQFAIEEMNLDGSDHGRY